MQEVEHLNIIEDKPIKLQDRKKRLTELDCEMELCYFDKNYNLSEDSVNYYKDLERKIKIFKTEVYDKLTAEHKHIIKLLDMYNMTTIKRAIKTNIKEIKNINK